MPTMNKIDLMDCANGSHSMCNDDGDELPECEVCGLENEGFEPDDGCPKSDPDCTADNGACHDACEAPAVLAWRVGVCPDYYREDDDNNTPAYWWEGEAPNRAEAIRLALVACHEANGIGSDSESYVTDPDDDSVQIVEADPDLLPIAKALKEWAAQMGGWDAPPWRALEAALAEIKA